VASTPDDAQKLKTLTDTKGVLESFLLAVKAIQTADPNDKQSSALISSCLNEDSAALGILLGNLQSGVTLDEKGDLDKLAEEELLKCAIIIKEAVRALEVAKPERKTPKIPGVLDRIDIDTTIVETAQAIANATGFLVQHAYGAQKERLVKRRQPGYHNDPTWANGLISASHDVADSVQSLVKAANKAATGMADEEELVAIARAVASSSAHLVSASRAKVDPKSASHKNLSDAAKSVANATSKLVAVATMAINLAAEATQSSGAMR